MIRLFILTVTIYCHLRAFSDLPEGRKELIEVQHGLEVIHFLNILSLLRSSLEISKMVLMEHRVDNSVKHTLGC